MSNRDPNDPDAVDLNAQESQRRLLEAQEAINQGRVPFVHPAVQDPRAISHAAQVAARGAARSAGIPPAVKAGLAKYRAPVAGGKGPPIPALEAEPVKGHTMAAQAVQSRGPGDSAAVQRAMETHGARGGSIITRDAAPPRQAPLLLKPGDILPPEAEQDPQFQRGAGSMIAQLQPHLAQRYGVIRGGQRLAPGQLSGDAPAMPSPENRFRRPVSETVRDLEAAVQATSGQGQGQGRPAPRVDDQSPPPPAGIPRTDAEAEAQASEGPGGAAARTGKSPSPPALEDPEVEEALGNMGDLDVSALRRQMMRDILKNPRQREAVEARLPPLGMDDLAELLQTNRLRQRVPVVPGIFEPTFETMNQDVEFELKQLLMLESESVNITESYLMDKYAVMTMTAGTVSINNNPLPSMYDAQGRFDRDRFWEKFNWVTRKPLHMLASLGIHYAWFEARVRKLFKVDEVKNG